MMFHHPGGKTAKQRKGNKSETGWSLTAQKKKKKNRATLGMAVSRNKLEDKGPAENTTNKHRSSNAVVYIQALSCVQKVVGCTRKASSCSTRQTWPHYLAMMKVIP